MILEIRRCCTDSASQTAVDLIVQNVAGPAVFGRCCGVPVAVGQFVEFVEQHSDVAPWQLANRLLANCIAVPDARHLPHVLEIGSREPTHVGESCSEIDRELVDHLRTPAFGFLALHDCVPDVPVQGEEFGVNDSGGANTGSPNLRFEVIEKLGVVGR